MSGATNDELRKRYLISDLFADDEIRLNYTHYERMVIGGAAPVSKPVSLLPQQEPASAKDKPFLERREMGVVNVSAFAGLVTVDGQRVELQAKDSLYIPMGSSEVKFESLQPAQPAKFYLGFHAGPRTFRPCSNLNWKSSATQTWLPRNIQRPRRLPTNRARYL